MRRSAVAIRRFAVVTAALLLGTLPLQGCHRIEDLVAVCTLQLVHGVEVEVRDSVTGDHLSPEPTGTLTDGEYRETMELAYDQRLIGAPERAGIYRVEISAEGYRTWTRSAIVRQDRCHVITVELTARMVPLPPDEAPAS